jgi:hypothetical protein
LTQTIWLLLLKPIAIQELSIESPRFDVKLKTVSEPWLKKFISISESKRDDCPRQVFNKKQKIFNLNMTLWFKDNFILKLTRTILFIEKISKFNLGTSIFKSQLFYFLNLNCEFESISNKDLIFKYNNKWLKNKTIWNHMTFLFIKWYNHFVRTFFSHLINSKNYC